jgi:hypothetical protein
MAEERDYETCGRIPTKSRLDLEQYLSSKCTLVIYMYTLAIEFTTMGAAFLNHRAQ